jgi:glutaminyl-peptide cyclotransferase
MPEIFLYCIQRMRLDPRLRCFQSCSLLLAALAQVGCYDGMRDVGAAHLIPSAAHPQQPAQIPLFKVKLVHAYPHDPHAFTQGLEYYGGCLYESTGLAGQSTLRKVALETGEVVRKINLPPEYFGEGLTIFHGKIYQLTWMSKKGFIYDLRNFRQVGEFPYDTEGWGLTHDDKSLILSDGTNKIRYIDPVSFAVTRTIEVYAGREGVVNLNELEYIKDEIFANIWHSSQIARIDPNSAQVVAWIDFTSIVSKEQHSEEAVLNGIAYDKTGDRLFVTGKNWSKLFEIKLEDGPR